MAMVTPPSAVDHQRPGRRPVGEWGRGSAKLRINASTRYTRWSERWSPEGKPISGQDGRSRWVGVGQHIPASPWQDRSRFSGAGAEQGDRGKNHRQSQDIGACHGATANRCARIVVATAPIATIGYGHGSGGHGHLGAHVGRLNALHYKAGRQSHDQQQVDQVTELRQLHN